MAHVLETSHRQDRSGIGRVLNGGHEIAVIHWLTRCINGNQCIQGADANDVLGLVTARLANENEGGFGSPANAQAIALIEQAKTLLAGGQATMDDGTPILGATE